MLQMLANLCNTSTEEVSLFFESVIKWLVNAAIWCIITGIIFLALAGLMFLIVSVDNKSTACSKHMKKKHA